MSDLDAHPQIDPIFPRGTESVAQLIDQMFARSGFNARRLAEACRLYRHMLTEQADVTVGLTVAGALTPIGMSGVIIQLVKGGFVDFIISTGANIYHDLHRAFDQPMCQGHFHVDDNQLAERGVVRIHDVFLSERDSLLATDRIIQETLREHPFTGPITTRELHAYLGREIARRATHPDRSFLVCATEHGVPIYTSAPGDSSVAMNILPLNIEGRRPILLDPIRDVWETSAIVHGAEKNGVVILGGGSPKNFYLQTQPTLHQILDAGTSKGGHDYMIQFAADAPHWGGLSGATPSEAKSWGKVKDAVVNNVVVYSCASILLPLLATYVLATCPPRAHKRLSDRMNELVELLESRRRQKGGTAR